MKKILECGSIRETTPDESKIIAYRKLLLAEMRKMGADESDLDLVCDAIIVNAINNDRKAEDVAWAILQ